MTSYSLLKKAREIDPNIYQRQVQRFLELSRKDPHDQADWQRAKSHQERNVVVVHFSKRIGEAFLRRVRQGPLTGLYVGEHAEKRPRVRRVGPWQPDVPRGFMVQTQAFRKARETNRNLQGPQARYFMEWVRKQVLTGEKPASWQGEHSIAHLKYRVTFLPLAIVRFFIRILGDQKRSKEFFAERKRRVPFNAKKIPVSRLPAEQRKTQEKRKPKQKTKKKAKPKRKKKKQKAKPKAKRKVQPKRKRPKKSEPPPKPPRPEKVAFSLIESDKPYRIVLLLLINALRAQSAGNFERAAIARVFGVRQMKIDQLVKQNILDQDKKGRITRESIDDLINTLKKD